MVRGETTPFTAVVLTATSTTKASLTNLSGCGLCAMLRGILQPAVKCRGKEYLRIIYGAEYTTEENLQQLRKRGLSLKRSLAMREFALGVESLERFVAGSPLRRVHGCVFGGLALGSEAVDPRL